MLFCACGFFVCFLMYGCSLSGRFYCVLSRQNIMPNERVSNRHFTRWNKTSIGSRGQGETHLQVEYLRSNKDVWTWTTVNICYIMKWWPSWLQCKCEWWLTTRIQKSKSILCRLNQLRDSQAPSCLSGPRTDVTAELPYHKPCIRMMYFVKTTQQAIFEHHK